MWCPRCSSGNVWTETDYVRLHFYRNGKLTRDRMRADEASFQFDCRDCGYHWQFGQGDKPNFRKRPTKPEEARQ